MADRLGRQTPTQSFVLPYYESKGNEAVDLYNSSEKKALEWQELLISDILAVGDDGLWIHQKYGYSVPRRNGKNEVIVMRELYGLKKGEKIMHTAHRTTTSASASKRLADLLNLCGYTEVIRVKQGEDYEKCYTYTKQLGLEKITLLDEGGGSCSFRTRSAKGGLGEGYDLLVIDEAQEYTDDQESALKYVVSDSKNPQTLMCGTPPTAVSSGTVFLKYRNKTLSGRNIDSGWAEWSVPKATDVRDRDAWYETNPSLGVILTERKIVAEITNDDTDFNIQRLGLWIVHNLKSAIDKNEWNELKVNTAPVLVGQCFIGIKYGHDGKNVAMSVAVRDKNGKIFVETLDCMDVRSGNSWILGNLAAMDIAKVAIDGASGQQLLANDMSEAGLMKPVLPLVKDIILANSVFEQAIAAGTLAHAGQPSVVQIATNCEKRAIGSNGGFGYKSIKEGVEAAILDSIIIAHWLCSTSKAKKSKQRISC